MDRTRQLPLELWEQIIRMLALSYRPEQKQRLVELTHLCWSLAVATRPTLYRTVFVSSRNVHRICARVQQDADAFRTWSRGLWMLDAVSPMQARVLSSAFTSITVLGGILYAFRTFNSELLRPRFVVLDAHIRQYDWQQLRPAIHPFLAHAKHLHFGIILIGQMDSNRPPAEVPAAEVVVVDLFIPDGSEQPVNPESFISLVLTFLKSHALQRLEINLDVNAKEQTSVVYEALLDVLDPRLRVQYEEIPPMSRGFNSLPRFLHYRHLYEFAIATA